MTLPETWAESSSSPHPNLQASGPSVAPTETASRTQSLISNTESQGFTDPIPQPGSSQYFAQSGFMLGQYQKIQPENGQPNPTLSSSARQQLKLAPGTGKPEESPYQQQTQYPLQSSGSSVKIRQMQASGIQSSSPTPFHHHVAPPPTGPMSTPASQETSATAPSATGHLSPHFAPIAPSATDDFSTINGIFEPLQLHTSTSPFAAYQHMDELAGLFPTTQTASTSQYSHSPQTTSIAPSALHPGFDMTGESGAVLSGSATAQGIPATAMAHFQQMQSDWPQPGFGMGQLPATQPFTQSTVQRPSVKPLPGTIALRPPSDMAGRPTIRLLAPKPPSTLPASADQPNGSTPGTSSLYAPPPFPFSSHPRVSITTQPNIAYSSQQGDPLQSQPRPQPPTIQRGRVFCPDQLVQLEARYNKNPTPKREERTRIAKELKVTEGQVANWFMRRRKRENTMEEDEPSRAVPASGTEDQNSATDSATGVTLQYTQHPIFNQAWLQQQKQQKGFQEGLRILLEPTGALKGTSAVPGFSRLLGRDKNTLENKLELLECLVKSEHKTDALKSFCDGKVGPKRLRTWLVEWGKEETSGESERRTQVLLKVLKVISILPLNVDHLKESALGRAIKLLQPSAKSPEVQKQCRELLQEWTKLVKTAKEQKKDKSLVVTSESLRGSAVENEPRSLSSSAETGNSTHIQGGGAEVVKSDSKSARTSSSLCSSASEDPSAEESNPVSDPSGTSVLPTPSKKRPASDIVPAHGSEGRSRKQLRVSFAEPNDLVKIRIIENVLDDGALKRHVQKARYLSAREMERLEGLEIFRKNPRQLEGNLTWTKPARLPEKMIVQYGKESEEGKALEERENTALLAVYVDDKQIPSNPAEPGQPWLDPRTNFLKDLKPISLFSESAQARTIELEVEAKVNQAQTQPKQEYRKHDSHHIPPLTTDLADKISAFMAKTQLESERSAPQGPIKDLPLDEKGLSLLKQLANQVQKRASESPKSSPRIGKRNRKGDGGRRKRPDRGGDNFPANDRSEHMGHPGDANLGEYGARNGFNPEREGPWMGGRYDMPYGGPPPGDFGWGYRGPPPPPPPHSQWADGEREANRWKGDFGEGFGGPPQRPPYGFRPPPNFGPGKGAPRGPEDAHHPRPFMDAYEFWDGPPAPGMHGAHPPFWEGPLPPDGPDRPGMRGMPPSRGMPRGIGPAPGDRDRVRPYNGVPMGVPGDEWNHRERDGYRGGNVGGGRVGPSRERVAGGRERDRGRSHKGQQKKHKSGPKR